MNVLALFHTWLKYKMVQYIVDYIHDRVDNSSVPISLSTSQSSEESPLVTFPVEHYDSSQQSPPTASSQNSTSSSSVVTPSNTAIRRNPARDRKPPKCFQN